TLAYCIGDLEGRMSLAERCQKLARSGARFKVAGLLILTTMSNRAYLRRFECPAFAELKEVVYLCRVEHQLDVNPSLRSWHSKVPFGCTAPNLRLFAPSHKV